MSARLESQVVELTCRDNGRIVAVRKNDLDSALADRQFFTDVVDPASVSKARRFLRQLERRGWAYDWELHAPLEGQPVSFHFAGRRNGDRLWIVGARTRRKLFMLLERGSGDGLDGLPDNERDGLTGAAADGFDYDELTRVNNEMTTLHRAVAKQASELEKLDRRKNQLLGMAAHDLRNPVAAIHAYSELLEMDLSPLLDPERLEFLTTIKTTSKFLLELVNDLLDLATIEAGELRLRLEPTELVSLVDATVRLNRILA